MIADFLKLFTVFRSWLAGWQFTRQQVLPKYLTPTSTPATALSMSSSMLFEVRLEGLNKSYLREQFSIEVDPILVRGQKPDNFCIVTIALQPLYNSGCIQLPTSLFNQNTLYSVQSGCQYHGVVLLNGKCIFTKSDGTFWSKTFLMEFSSPKPLAFVLKPKTRPLVLTQLFPTSRLWEKFLYFI